jgi:hypothetical protein
MFTLVCVFVPSGGHGRLSYWYHCHLEYVVPSTKILKSLCRVKRCLRLFRSMNFSSAPFEEFTKFLNCLACRTTAPAKRLPLTMEAASTLSLFDNICIVKFKIRYEIGKLLPAGDDTTPKSYTSYGFLTSYSFYNKP